MHDVYICMTILYRTTEFKSVNIFAHADSRQSTKFSSYTVVHPMLTNAHNLVMLMWVCAHDTHGGRAPRL